MSIFSTTFKKSIFRFKKVIFKKKTIFGRIFSFHAFITLKNSFLIKTFITFYIFFLLFKEIWIDNIFKTFQLKKMLSKFVFKICATLKSYSQITSLSLSSRSRNFWSNSYIWEEIQKDNSKSYIKSQQPKCLTHRIQHVNHLKHH